MTDLVAQNSEDPSNVRLKKLVAEAQRSQDHAMTPAEKPTYVTIDSNPNSRVKSNVVKVDGRKWVIKDKARIEATDLRWVDPSYKFNTPWTYTIPMWAIKNGFGIAGIVDDDNNAVAQAKSVNSIDHGKVGVLWRHGRH